MEINSLIAHKYTNNNQSVGILSDAAQNLSGKSLFCSPGWSQAYHCLQTMDQRSVEMIAFNFSGKISPHRRHAQGLSRSVSAFLNAMREYLGSVVKAAQCAQYVDKNGIAANLATDLPGTLGRYSSAFSKQD